MEKSPASHIPSHIAACLVILIVAATASFAIGLKIIFSPVASELSSLPDWYVILNGVVSLVLGIFYLWMGRMLFTKHPTARILVISIALANLIFSLTRLPVGAIAFAVNLLLLVFISTRTSRNWFSS